MCSWGERANDWAEMIGIGDRLLLQQIWEIRGWFDVAEESRDWEVEVVCAVEGWEEM